MIIINRQQNARIPSWALSYLVNGDSSGISVGDMNTVNRWLEHWTEYAERVSGILNINPVSEFEFFTRYPEFGLPCHCTECDITVYGLENESNEN
jgi:hypothetical protein